MKRGFLVNVVIAQRTSVLELLSGEDQSLLIRRNSLLVLNLLLDSFDRVRGFHVERDGLIGKSLDEDLHTSSESKDEMKRGFLRNVVIAQRTSVLELLSGEDQSLLIRRNSLLVLNLLLDSFDRVGGIHVERDGLVRKSLDKNLHLISFYILLLLLLLLLLFLL